MAQSWEKRAEDKKKRIFDSIPEEWHIKDGVVHGDSVMDYPKISGIMTDVELDITESSAVDLVTKLASGELTSIAVTTAFLKRAALAHQLV
jgi:amidase